jgi:tetratricopeptide (TPR) repeat protein
MARIYTLIFAATAAAALLIGCAGEPDPMDMDPMERATATTSHLRRGLDLWKYNKDYDGAIKEFEEAVRYEPSNPEAQQSLSVAYYEKMRMVLYMNAVPDLQRSQGLELGEDNRWVPTSKYSEEEKGNFLKEYKRKEKEICYPLLEKALEHAHRTVLLRKTPDVYELLWRICWCLNRLDEAKEALQEIFNDSTASRQWREQAKKLIDTVMEKQKADSKSSKNIELPDEFPPDLKYSKE